MYEFRKYCRQNFAKSAIIVAVCMSRHISYLTMESIQRLWIRCRQSKLKSKVAKGKKAFDST